MVGRWICGTRGVINAGDRNFLTEKVPRRRFGGPEEWIGVGTANWFRPPLPPNRTGGFQHVQQRGLHHAVADRGNSQRSFLCASQFLDPNPFHRLRPIPVRPQCLVKPVQFVPSPGQEAFHRLVVHSGCSLVADNVGASSKQIEQRVHFVNQRVPSSSSHSLLECRQHAVRPDARVRPVSYRGGLSGRCSHKGHCHRFVFLFPLFGRYASISLHPFAPPALPGFLATMGALPPEPAGSSYPYQGQ